VRTYAAETWHQQDVFHLVASTEHCASRVLPDSRLIQTFAHQAASNLTVRHLNKDQPDQEGTISEMHDKEIISPWYRGPKHWKKGNQKSQAINCVSMVGQRCLVASWKHGPWWVIIILTEKIRRGKKWYLCLPFNSLTTMDWTSIPVVWTWSVGMYKFRWNSQDMNEQEGKQYGNFPLGLHISSWMEQTDRWRANTWTSQYVNKPLDGDSHFSCHESN
jgi:hypothetical protein